MATPHSFHIYFLRAILFYLSVFLLNGCVKEPGLINRRKPEVIIAGGDSRLLQADIRLFADTVYILATTLTRSEGQSITVDAGTLIKVTDGNTIIIESGALINAQGSADKPIVFTSSAPTGGQGLQCGACTSNHFWYGITIHGNYLSAKPNLTSGVLSFVRIEFAGGNQNDALASLLLDNVNKETQVDNIEVSYSSYAPSIEMLGGNVNSFNLISYASNRSDFYLHGGYTGMLQNLLAYRHPYFPNSISRTVAGLDIDGDGDSTTSPVISNLTVLGPDLQPGTATDYSQEPPQRRSALLATGAARFHIRNSVFMGFPKAGFYIDDYSTAHALHFGESEFFNCIIHSNDTSRTFFLPMNTYLPYNSGDFKDYMLRPRFMNRLFISSDEFGFTDPFNYDISPNPLPNTGSVLLEDADFNAALFADPFFKKVNYIGALGDDNWMNQWTNFIPLQTNYNN